MKNSKKSKLGLSKIKIATLKNSNAVKGGTVGGRPTGNNSTKSYGFLCRDTNPDTTTGDGNQIIG